MATLKVKLDEDTFSRLAKSAAAERRPLDWQAETLLRRILNVEGAQDRKQTPEQWAALPAAVQLEGVRP